MRKWRESGNRDRGGKWRQREISSLSISSICLHFLYFSPFPLFPLIFSQCISFLAGVAKNTTWGHTYWNEKTSVKSDQECSSYRIKRYLPTAVWARNLKWELLNGKPLSILFRTELSIYYDFFDCTMNFGYVGGTWWSPRKYWWCYWSFPRQCWITEVMRPKFIILRRLCADKTIF